MGCVPCSSIEDRDETLSILPNMQQPVADEAIHSTLTRQESSDASTSIPPNPISNAQSIANTEYVSLTEIIATIQNEPLNISDISDLSNARNKTNVFDQILSNPGSKYCIRAIMKINLTTLLMLANIYKSGNFINLNKWTKNVILTIWILV